MTGKTIQNYYIESLLGEGGMGKVYKALDTTLGRKVAIKSLNVSLTTQPTFLERFKNEAKTLARLTHPNIAVLYNYLQDGMDYYMVMEYVEGENLDELSQGTRPIPYQLVVPIIINVLDGLDHAHKKGVLHRDIKPANIMLTKEYNVKLMDFGIAKVTDQVKLTQVSRLIGTLEFLAPELIEGNDPSPASDIYAMGVTMYELLTGKLPFSGKSDYMLMQEIVKEKPIVPENWNEVAPTSLAEIIMKALEKRPENRYTSAADFAQDLRMAFPNLKNVSPDLVRLISKATSVHEITTKPVGQPTVIYKSDIENPVPPSTILYKPSAPTQLVDSSKKQTDNIPSILKNKLLYIGTAILVVLSFIYFILFTGNNSNDDQQDTGAAGSSVLNEDSSSLTELNNDHQSNNDSLLLLLNKKKQEDSLNNIQNDLNKRLVDAGSSKKPENKKPEATTTENKKPGKPKPESEKKPDEDNSASTFSTKEPINLRGRGIPLTIALRENLSKETANEGDHVSFKVLDPGLYKDEVVIPQGSIIHGTIKGIGVIRMSIIFNSITIRGRTLHLNRCEAGANKETVFSGKSFRIGLRGTLNP